jgi:hypothetical protein
MNSSVDFTGLPEGTSIAEDGVIVHCLLCGRSGLRRWRADGSVRFVHVETARMFSDGLRFEPEDSCLLVVRRVA